MKTRFAIAAAVALALAAAASGADGPVPALGADAWRVGPKPNDDGHALALEWPEDAAEIAYFRAVEAATEAKKRNEKIESAGQTLTPAQVQEARAPAPPDYEYVIGVSGTSSEGPFLEVAKLLSTAALKKDATDVFGNEALGSKDHFAAVSLLSIVPPKLLANVALADKKPPGDRTPAEAQLIAKVGGVLGQATIDAAKALLEEKGVTSADELKDEAIANAVFSGYLGNGGLSKLILDRDWWVRLATRAGGNVVEAGPPKSARPHGALFHWPRLNNFLVMLLLAGLVLGFIQHARKNPNLFLRRIGGLDAVDEALGRATEMGKPVLFVHGLETMGSISTIAAVNILGEISKKVARYDSKLICVNNDPIVLAVSQETVKEGYLNAGRPDAFNPDDVYFVAAEQFSYVAAVDGIMVRQEPAANFYCGYFYAESLLLSETGATTGAIQIAATDAYTQLPFFVTTCDYTLMGEELYAASAYLSRDPLLLGSLKGQDVGKALMIAFLVIGTVLETAGIHVISDLLKAY
jgi:hypothetical protein